MRRLRRRRDRGAIAVLVALSMVALLGFTALGVDGGQVWSDRKQLQNGADAGALAIAQACAQGACGVYTSTADAYAKSNKLDGNATGTVTNLDTTAGSVTVQSSSTRTLLFAPVLGIPSANITASATATWQPIGGGTFIPLTISLCAFYAQTNPPAIVGDPIPTNTPMTIYYATPISSSLPISQDPSGACGSNPGAEPAGGFNWIGNQNKDCTATISAGGVIASQPGNTPKGCTWGSSLAGQTIQIPVFDYCVPSTGCANGANGSYHIYAIATFTITAYCFDTADYANVTQNCTGNYADHYISGYFVSFASIGSGWTTSGSPNLGTDQVSLTQ